MADGPHSVPRTGDTPIEFEGTLLVQLASLCPAIEFDRGYLIAIYKTTGGKYVGHVRYISKWRTESTGDTVYVQDSAQALAKALLGHDPLTYVVGYPPGKQFVEKQALLLASMRTAYLSLVGRALAEVPGAGHTV